MIGVAKKMADMGNPFEEEEAPEADPYSEACEKLTYVNNRVEISENYIT